MLYRLFQPSVKFEFQELNQMKLIVKLQLSEQIAKQLVIREGTARNNWWSTKQLTEHDRNVRSKEKVTEEKQLTA